MGVWDKIKNILTDAPIALEIHSVDTAFETKKAFDAMQIGVKGRVQYPDTDIVALLKWQKRNEIVFACLQKKAQAAIDPEIIVERKTSGDEWERVAGHPLVNLLNNPNPVDTGASFLGGWLNSEDLAGKFYAEIQRSSAGLPVRLWLLNPANINPVPGKNEDGSSIAYYEYKIGDQFVRLETTEVLARRNKDLTSQFGGLAPMEAALGAVDADAAMTSYVRGFFANGGVPSGLLKLENVTLTEEQAEIFRQKWTNRYGKGGRGERGVAVLDRNANYERIGVSLNELESDSTRGQAEARICSIFGVPPILIGAYVGLLHANQRASAREAQADFWMNTMSPLFKSLRIFLTWKLLPEFEPLEDIQRGKVRVSWDMSKVLGLQEDLSERHVRAAKAFEIGGITLNEYREMIGFKADETGDYYLRLNARQPVTPENAAATSQLALLPQNVQTTEALDAVAVDDEKTVVTNEKQKQIHTTPAPKLLTAQKSSTKTFDFDGLTLRREPNEFEARLDLKSIDNSFDDHKEKIQSVLETLRVKLIEQSVEAFTDVADKELFMVNLTPPPQVFTKLKKQISRAFNEGAKQIAAELATQKNLETLETKAIKEPEEELDELSDLTISRVVNDVQTRAIAGAAQLTLVGVAADEIGGRLKSLLDEGSTGYLSRAAGGAANAAIGRGRASEIETRKDEWETLQYSALLDRNTCEPCGDADGLEADNYDDLPDTPNTDCDGLDLCRCFIVAISK